MSTPNEPDSKQPNPEGTPPRGPVAGPPAGPSKGAAPEPAKGGLVPPWQRGPGSQKAPVGPGGVNGSASSTVAKPVPPGSGTHPNGPTPPSGAQPNGPVPAAPAPASSNGAANGRSGPPPRGVVSAPVPPSSSGPQAPLPESERPGGGTATATEAPAKFVESPTRNIARENLPDSGLPNLDVIHHVDDTAKPVQLGPTPPRSAPAQIGSTQPLRAAVQIRRIDPWATFKITAVLAVAGFFIWMISVAVLYLVLDGMGVWDQVNSSFGTLVTADGSSSEGDIIGAGTVFGYAILLGAINAILLTALATVGAYIYNLCADLIGGAEVTLADLD